MQHIRRHTKRVFVAIVGFTVLLIGVILIPYPGPGWLIVFAGLAILATEFAFAERLLAKLRAQYEQWLEWIKRQPRWVQMLTLAFTGIVVVVTIWLFNGYGFINNYFNLGLDWLISPFFR